jgi:hypothetical protein
MTATLCAVSMAVMTVGCSAQASADPPPSPSAPGAPANPAVKLVIDGKEQSVLGTPSCSDHSGGIGISVGEKPRDVFIRLIPWNSPLLVGEVSFGSGFTGAEPAYDGKADGSDVTSNVAEEGDTYKIRRDAFDGASPESNPNEPFELAITCIEHG